jgi:hypothetical protein|tara:strand:+ start:7010 stop:7354 length:345 start_codon:yes stop_codon:yes gene_type:complete
MSITERIEEKFGIKVENFNKLEKATYFEMLNKVQKAQLSPDKWRDYIISMRESVERELIKEPEFIRIWIFKFENRNQILLKARLQNYLLMESFLISPQKAQQQLEDMIEGMLNG